jgi:hypothetical protein
MTAEERAVNEAARAITYELAAIRDSIDALTLTLNLALRPVPAAQRLHVFGPCWCQAGRHDFAEAISLNAAIDISPQEETDA